MALLKGLFTSTRNRLSDKKGVTLVDLPDDCLAEILSRLRSKDIYRIRRVCKRLYFLTSSTHFKEAHAKRAPSIIVAQVVKMRSNRCFGCGRNYFSIDDEKGKIKLKRSKFKILLNHTNSTDHLVFSFGGLLVFQGFAMGIRRHIIVNPMTNKSRVIIPTTPRYPSWDLCAMFFYPLMSEYKLLFVGVEEDKRSCWYYVYGPTSSTWRKINTTPLLFRPSYRCDPIVHGTSLYWMLLPYRGRPQGHCSTHAIMVFKMDSEEIFTIPHPVIDDCYDHEKMILFEMDKCICLFQITPNMYRCRIDIWELNDYVNWSWVRRHTIHNVNMPACSYDDRFATYQRRTKIFYVRKDILLINLHSSGLYVLNLAQTTLYKLLHEDMRSHHLYMLSDYTCSLLVPDV